MKLKKAISDRGFDAESAAVALGISRSTLYNLYKKTDVGSDVLEKASRLTGVNMDYWFNEESIKLDKIETNHPAENDYLLKYIAKLERESEEKDQTIRFQQREIELLLGKSDGVSHDQHVNQRNGNHPPMYRRSYRRTIQ